MFTRYKKLIAVILLIAMTVSNSGMSAFAVSISHYVDKATEEAPDNSDITYRYYEQFSYSKTTYLMNDSEESEDGVGACRVHLQRREYGGGEVRVF